MAILSHSTRYIQIFIFTKLDRECPGFQFVIPVQDLTTNGSKEEYTVNLIDYDIKITYNIQTHIQTLHQKKVKSYNFQENLELFNELISHQKNFVYSLYMAVRELQREDYSIQITYMSYQKVILLINNTLKMSFLLNFSRTEMTKILITPSIASLNCFLASKFMKALQYEDVKIIKQIFTIYLYEFIQSYKVFQMIFELQNTLDSLRKGPQVDNIAYTFDFQQTQFHNQLTDTMDTSFEQQNQLADYKKELIMIVNYRKFYQVAFKIDKVNKKLCIADYAKQTYYYPDDHKLLLFIPHGSGLAACLQELIDKKLQLTTNDFIVFGERYGLNEEKTEFLFNVSLDHMEIVQLICETVFDYIGCIYLMIKVKQILQLKHMKKLESINKVEAKFLIVEEPKYTGRICTVIQNYQFKLKLMLESSNELINNLVEQYFHIKLQRCFYNYKALKGMAGILLTKIFTHIYVYELMYFEINRDQGRPFLTNHSQQAELDQLVPRKKLDIEIALENIDFQNGREFVIKFIDPRTKKYKFIKFVETTNEGVFSPENFQNPDYNRYIQQQQTKKFLQRICFLMTIELDELY
ncbi:UNKNOWN [Stylonychia lemnae]|uniref:Uncharacterized protein n=1 Tax=Stylonychia lemnae TaxID=5949 RepID=A0A078B6Z0_STYLE|nr:UNKNOWN [Stylonychia lemnae]|eukprot:CDW89328.1 UNKNOWN [Stylonychia lemnae]